MSVTNTKASSVDKIIATLLKNRGINTKKEKEEFFNPSDPNKIDSKEFGVDEKELTKAVMRIKKAIEKKEKIIVWGDYDVDGICATAILWETLHFGQASSLPYIPSRFNEGYGLNEESIKKLKDENENLGLIITVDHGITAHEKIKFAKKLGIDIIVVDHHEPLKAKLPAAAVVHTQEISGSGVAWVLARELGKSQNIPTDHIGLAALGTVADVLPLVGHNRSIVVYGLRELRKSNRPGLVSLCSEAAINQRELGTYHIGYVVGPRLNSMGRVEHAMDSLRLICTRSPGRATELASKIGKTNKVRQEKTQFALGHVNESYGSGWSNGSLPKLIFVHHESYEEGVIGIVAGKLVDQYHRPSIVASRGEEVSKASARSISGVNIVDTIRKAGGKMLVSVGGHPMAAGFTVKTKDIEALSKKLSDIASREITDKMVVRSTRVDCELSLSEVSDELYAEIVKFAPFGFGNPEPAFKTDRVKVEEARLVGKDNDHLKMVLSSSAVFPAIAFGMGEVYPKLKQDALVNLVYSIKQNEWNGRRKLELGIKDIKLSD